MHRAGGRRLCRERTVWLLQRGSPESKSLDQAGLESDSEQKVGRCAEAGLLGWPKAAGFRRFAFTTSLGLVMGVSFLGSWLAQASPVRRPSTGSSSPTSRTRSPSGATSGGRTSGTALQNCQSELLAVGSMAVLSIYLRQRGSPQSKPVGAPHEATGVEG